MAVRHLKPTSAGRRFQTISDFAEITTDKPEKSLLEPLPKKAGRNNNGRITTRHQGGGHKRQYRRIDFKRRKDDIPAKVAILTVPLVLLFCTMQMAQRHTSFAQRA